MSRQSDIDFEAFSFAEVVKLPPQYHVFDLTSGAMDMPPNFTYGVGKYNEHRPDIYSSPLFAGERDYHIGIDIFAPQHTEIHNFYDGVVYQRAYNGEALDYGYTLVLKYELNNTPLYALFGHLSKASYHNNPPGKIVAKGEQFAWMGPPEENGGWPAHLHLQLCYECPSRCDMPGVVNKADLEAALRLYPDPQKVLGKLY
ncbi:peptidase M23 [Alteromonas sediminis]|uniref:Peptidase M23 n=1 Tax=Alteromonas sediminis TaxID=2259342 RepID=A0A3N5YER6_9ALTE|nr:peptidoglycan DD-metalloendopeptidase family protein [Alteromonas sediminis]RPJ68345.1 peptidase M23 [Alteromonas sediminis]